MAEPVNGRERGQDRPNVLFFFTDDQRFDTVRGLGNAEILTPNIDSIAQRGVSFTRAHIMGGTCPAVCMPSRAMLMSGLTLFHLDDRGQDIPDEHTMLPEALRSAGYATFGTGKWHNGTRAYTRCFSHGAEIFFGGMNDHWNVPACDFDADGAYPEPRYYTSTCGDIERTWRLPFDHVREGKHSSELFCDAAIDFLRGYDDAAPFFMYVSFMAPHDPRTMPAEFLDMYDPDRIALPKSFMPEHPFDNGELRVRDELLAAFPRTAEEIRRHIAEYYAMITHADAQMGRVMAALEETGRAENTISVFAGDNGLALGRHGLMGKQNLYDHSVRVPLMMAGPGVPACERRDAFCYLLDIFPTLCDLTGVDVPESVEGKSLLPAMRDPAERVRDTLHFAYRDFQRAVRDERFKLIEYVVDGKRTTQLFDLSEDPWETCNLAEIGSHADVTTRLRKELLRWRDEYDDWGERFWEMMNDEW